MQVVRCHISLQSVVEDRVRYDRHASELDDNSWELEGDHKALQYWFVSDVHYNCEVAVNSWELDGKSIHTSDAHLCRQKRQ